VELGLGLGRDFSVFEVGGAVAYSPDFFGGSGSAVYTRAELGVPVGSTPLSLDLAVGRQAISDNEAFGTPDYTDWSIGLSAGLGVLDVGAAYVGTDLGESACFGGSDVCRRRLVLSLTLGS
jgi:uncharacterized protein (TIGR02001 family)